MTKNRTTLTKTAAGTTFLRDGKFALGIVVGLGVFLLVFLAMQDFSGDSGVSYEQVAIVVSLLIAFTSSMVAVSSLTEQRRTREASTDPVLIAHFGQREDARELVMFSITNVGAGAALNVKLNVERPLEDSVERNLLTDIFELRHPFRIIPQNEKISFNLAVGWDLLGDKLLPPFKAHLRYEDLDGSEYESIFELDVRELERRGTEKSPTMRIAAALEKIAKKP